MDFKKLGFMPADILIPKNADMAKWSVVACDQYTSQPEYWERVSDFVGNNESTLNMVFPEIYLDDDNKEQRINEINDTMTEYLEQNIFNCFENSFVYVERTVAEGKVRKGIVGAVDLERYDYNKGSKSLIRATEGTVLERIPPRVKIRKNASLELPHIMLLINDSKRSVIEPVDTSKLEKLYDFDLMENSGHITGWLLKPDERIFNALSDLFDGSENPLVYAVGDGNHSLATAKACWEEKKKTLSPEERETSPARYALCELVNIMDNALEFEPIHRAVFNCNVKDLIQSFNNTYKMSDNGQKITYCYGNKEETVYISNPVHKLGVGSLQAFLDDYAKSHDIKIDYIHGAEVTKKLAQSENTVGFILEPMQKSDLFEAVQQNGVLPRKTFSMGEAFEKRFYLEAKKI